MNLYEIHQYIAETEQRLVDMGLYKVNVCIRCYSGGYTAARFEIDFRYEDDYSSEPITFDGRLPWDRAIEMDEWLVAMMNNAEVWMQGILTPEQRKKQKLMEQIMHGKEAAQELLDSDQLDQAATAFAKALIELAESVSTNAITAE